MILSHIIQVHLEFSAHCINDVIYERHNMIMVEKYSGVGQAFGNSTVVGTAHVHSHGFAFFGLPGKHLQERLHILL